MDSPSEPYPNWHCVWLDPDGGEWVVRCLPHGEITRQPTHLAAFEAALQHDVDTGAFDNGRGFDP